MGDTPTVGFVGLGTMGGPMAAKLVAAGFPVVAFDLVPGRVASLASESAANRPPGRQPTAANRGSSHGIGGSTGHSIGGVNGSLTAAASPAAVAGEARVIVLSRRGPGHRAEPARPGSSC